MNSTDTKETLIAAARKLFASRGFKGTSVRAVTSAAKTNLGAVTYHFGSKKALYHAVLDQATRPIREQFAQIDSEGRSAIDQIEVAIRAMFGVLREHTDIPRLLLQVLTADESVPPPIEMTMKNNLSRLTQLVAAGQRDGTVRDGSPMLLALAFAGQPIFFGIYRKALQETIGLDQADEATSTEIVDTVVSFIRDGLAS